MLSASGQFRMLHQAARLMTPHKCVLNQFLDAQLRERDWTLPASRQRKQHRPMTPYGEPAGQYVIRPTRPMIR